MEWQNYPEFFLGMSETQLEKHETGPHRMAEARPEETNCSQILRSRLVCAVNEDFGFLNKFLS